MTPIDRLSTPRARCEPSPQAQSAPTALSAFLAFLLLSSYVGYASAYNGRVVDDVTRQPVAGAIVTVAGNSVRTREDGSFQIGAVGGQISVRAHGYSRHDVAPPQFEDEPLEIPLRSFSPQAIYLSLFGLEYLPLGDAVMGLLSTTRVNALVIDVKNEQGALSLRSPGPLAIQDGARGLATTTDVRGLLTHLHQSGMYAIARIAVFKDNYLAHAYPRMALRTKNGAILRDNDGIAWSDPRNKAVWEYNIAVAIEAARQGFDEIQFDFVRFPSVKTLTPAVRRASQARRAAIRGFLAAARAALMPHNVFVAANVYGYASWDPNDSNIGQKLEDIAAEVDYICLMLYPSSFKHGIPAARMPLDHPDKIVELSLRRAQQRTGLPALRFRPWLQAFRDHNFDHRPFGRPEISAQVQAAERFGSNGWMLWHPYSIYSEEDLPSPVIGVDQVTR